MTALIHTKSISRPMTTRLDSHQPRNQICFGPGGSERCVFQDSTGVDEAEDFGEAVDAVWEAHEIAVWDEEEESEEVED